MTLRRRRMLATLLALALCLSLLPMSALAAEADALGETGPEEAVCTCTAPCTEGGMNTACPVCGAEGAAPEDCGQSLPQGSGEAKTQPLANDGISLLSTQENVSYIDPTEEQTEQTCTSATVVTADDTTWGNDDNDGWYVVNDDVTIGQRVTVTGDVHLILTDGASLDAAQGVNVGAGNSLTIYGQSDGTGELYANYNNGSRGMLQNASAGIGSNEYEGCGTITINGGRIFACGGVQGISAGAGIGCGWNPSTYRGTESITINGGCVTAKGASADYGGGAGIGGAGNSGSISSVTITGGVIVAEGGSNGAAGIGGGGHDGKLDSISITGGWIQATGHGRNGNDNNGNANAIGGGASKNPADTSKFSNTVILDGHTKTGTVYGSASIEENAEIPEGYTLTIESGKTLTIPADGTLINNGTIFCYGTINGNVVGDVRYPSGVTVTFSGEGVNTSAASYGSTIAITATMTKQTATNALTAAEGTVDFWLGAVDTGTELGSANVTSSGGTYTATLTLTDDMWANGFAIGINTITADFGGVAGTSGDGLLPSTGTATLTVTKGNQTAPTAPTMSSRTTNSVTLNAISSAGQGAVQYGYVQGDNGTPNNWQDNTTFNGLSAGTTYTFYARYAGNDYYEPSPASTGTSIVTLGAEGGDTLADGETITTDDGTTITNDGEKITITPDDGGTTTTITPDKGATVNGDGSVNVPGGSTVTTGDGPSITVGEGGATVGTDGSVTLPEGGSATIGSGDDTTTITTPGGGTIDPDTGAVTPDEGGSVVIGSGEDTTTVTPPNGQPVTPNEDGTITVPGGSTVQTGDGPEMTLPGGGTIDPGTGAVTPDEGGSVVIGSGDDTTTITPPSGQPVTPNDDGSITIPGGSTVTGSDGESVTIPPEGGTLQPGGDVEYTVTVTFDSQGGSQVPSQDITVGEPVSQPDDPTRTGYRFLGWYTAATGGARWDFTQPVTGDQTLYAQWAYLPPANPNYKITIGDTENGTVTVNPTAAKEGTTVTITPVPDAGYQVGTVSVTDRFGQAVAVDQQADGTYTFVMPDGQVTVEVTFLQGEAPDLPFSDVTESDWFYDAVTYAYENGLMDGVGMGLFAPNSETTRAQLVTILHRLAGQPAPSGDSGFSDVETGTWYTDAVAWAAQNGIVNGVSDTQFAPGDDITREQLAVILYRYATYQGYDVSQRADLSGFVDAGTISTYAQEALSWANAQGLVLGFEDDSLRPQGTATRAQIAAVLMRFCQTVAE